LILKYGAEGYAIYFHCLELIAGDVSENNITFELEHDAEIIADNLKIRPEQGISAVDKVNNIMKYIIELGLFDESSGKIFCFKMAKRIDKSMVKNDLIKTIANKYEFSVKTHEDSRKVLLEEKRREEKRREENKQEEIRIKEKLNVCFISDDIIEIPDKENDKTGNDVAKNQSGGEVEEIYKSYPGKCPVSSRVTGKSSKDKDKIKKVLKTISYQELKETINLYLEECIKTKTYIKNFDTFLNNLPDLNDLKLKSPKDETKEERALRIAKLAFGDIIKNEREIKSEVIYE